MRFERTDPFKADYRRLPPGSREMFRAAAHEFNSACDRFVETRDPSKWPGSLRVKAVVNAPGVLSRTWSFSGPNGRATWEWTTVTDAEGDVHPAGPVEAPGRSPDSPGAVAGPKGMTRFHTQEVWYVGTGAMAA